MLLGTVILVTAAIGLAGPLDPAPDRVEANSTAETGTVADQVAEDVGLDNEHDVEASAKDWAEVRYREEPADVDTSEGTVEADGAGPVPEQEAETPSTVTEGASEAADTSVAVTFSTQLGTGAVVDASDHVCREDVDTCRAHAYTPDGRLSLGISTRNTDASPSGGAATVTGVADLGPYYTSSLPPVDEPGARPDGPTRAPPAPDSGQGTSSSGTGSGSASTQSTNAAAGLTDVVGLDNGAKAVAAAAAGTLPILAWFLYHRIKGHDVLDNEKRKAIYDEVCREPGLGVKDLAEVADVSYSTASYHLQRLEDADMVVSSKRGKKLCYFQNGGTFTESERELLKVLRNEGAMQVFLDIHQHPGTYRTRIADRLDVSTTTVNWHLDGLVDAGLVREDRDGRTAHLYVDQERLDEGVRPLLDKTADGEVETPAPMTQLRSRLGTPATA